MPKLHRGWLGFAAGVALSLAIQAGNYVAARNNWVGNAQSVGPSFFHNFSWALSLMSGGFFFLVGSLYQRRAEQEEENKEIQAFIASKKNPQ